MPDILSRAAASFEHGALAEAESFCRESLRLSPKDPFAHTLLGRILDAAGQIEAGQAAFQVAVSTAPTCTDAWAEWAKVLQKRGYPQKAEECLSLGLKYNPNSLPLLQDMSILLIYIGKLEEAGQHLRHALQRHPESYMAWYYLGIVCKGQGKVEDAVAAYRQAILINPSFPEAHNNLGDALRDSDLDAAANAFNSALSLRAAFPEALDNLGIIHFFKGQLQKALDCFGEALALSPNFHRALGHKTTALFLTDRLPEAWRLYRHRFQVAGIKIRPHGRFPIAEWDGEPLKGTSLLVWTELGLGEEVMQASMFQDVLGVVSHLTVECSPRLVNLFTRSFPNVRFIPRTNPSRACPVPIDADFQIAGGDLGAVFRNDREAFPRHLGYLVADAARVEELRRKYRKKSDDFVVGISWASNRSSLGKDKTMALMEFAPILRQPGVVFVNLQYATDSEEIAGVREVCGAEFIIDETVDALGDMDAVAAQIAALDLVISVSNTAAHVAGALNVPVWNIVPSYNASGMWHWFSDTNECAWYPSMKIYRRTSKKSDVLMAKIASDLQGAREVKLASRRGRS